MTSCNFNARLVLHNRSIKSVLNTISMNIACLRRDSHYKLKKWEQHPPIPICSCRLNFRNVTSCRWSHWPLTPPAALFVSIIFCPWNSWLSNFKSDLRTEKDSFERMRFPGQECGNRAMKRVTVFVHVCVWLCTACVLPLDELQCECICLNSLTSFGVVYTQKRLSNVFSIVVALEI